MAHSQCVKAMGAVNLLRALGVSDVNGPSPCPSLPCECPFPPQHRPLTILSASNAWVTTFERASLGPARTGQSVQQGFWKMRGQANPFNREQCRC
jgi:hypothetical protein